VRCALTNKAPAGAYRGAGGPEAVFALERMMDKAARELGIDPAEIRRRSFIQPEEFPWQTGLGSAQVPIVYDSGQYEAGLNRALELADYAGWRAKQQAAHTEGRYLGIGVSSFVLLGGLGPYESAEVRVDPSGDVVIVTGAHAHGQGTDTALAQIAADELATRPELVTVAHGDTDQIPFGVGTYASRNAVMAGGAVVVAAGALPSLFAVRVRSLPAKTSASITITNTAPAIHPHGVGAPIRCSISSGPSMSVRPMSVRPKSVRPKSVRPMSIRRPKSRGSVMTHLPA
jgi:CO/xanthine dehydrogenase Mo-binding subunit